MRGSLTDTVEALVAEWIRTFGEPPVVADVELMTALLAEHHRVLEPR